MMSPELEHFWVIGGSGGKVSRQTYQRNLGKLHCRNPSALPYHYFIRLLTQVAPRPAPA